MLSYKRAGSDRRQRCPLSLTSSALAHRHACSRDFSSSPLFPATTPCYLDHSHLSASTTHLLNPTNHPSSYSDLSYSLFARSFPMSAQFSSTHLLLDFLVPSWFWLLSPTLLILPGLVPFLSSAHYHPPSWILSCL